MTGEASSNSPEFKALYSVFPTNASCLTSCHLLSCIPACLVLCMQSFARVPSSRSLSQCPRLLSCWHLCLECPLFILSIWKKIHPSLRVLGRALILWECSRKPQIPWHLFVALTLALPQHLCTGIFFPRHLVFSSPHHTMKISWTSIRPKT